MNIRRIDSYRDSRFSQPVLNQHGAYLIDGEPYEIEITGPSEAVIRGENRGAYEQLIEQFRFHAPHISRFQDEKGETVEEYEPAELREIDLADIQPSQFFIDEDKLEAIRSFVHGPEDIVIQVVPYGERFISLDGHTRLYLAVLSGYQAVRTVLSETDEWLWPFVREAESRNIRTPADMILLTHEEYEVKWNQYCDEVFADGQLEADEPRG